MKGRKRGKGVSARYLNRDLPAGTWSFDLYNMYWLSSSPVEDCVATVWQVAKTHADAGAERERERYIHISGRISSAQLSFGHGRMHLTAGQIARSQSCPTRPCLVDQRRSRGERLNSRVQERLRRGVRG